MQTLTISIQNKDTEEKIRWFLKHLKGEGVEVISSQPYPISKNKPNAKTVKALQDTEYETVTLEEFRDMCQ